MQAVEAAETATVHMNGHALQHGTVAQGAQVPTPVHAQPAAPATYVLAPPAPATGDFGLPWPPGMAGALAGFIYNSAPRPVKEVAIVAALGWLAGVAGKAYMVPQSGLNIYLVLVARSAVGKEAMHSGISLLTRTLLEKGFVTASHFVDFTEYASGPALQKAVAANQSFLNISGEWGRKLRRLAHDNERDGPMQSLRTVMTNLYQKSGPQSIVGGLGYSNKEQNVASISGVAYSLIGETTPGTFYDALTESMMEDGFLSRFTIVEYNGDRPPMNAMPQLYMDDELVQVCGKLTHQAAKLNEMHRNHMVQRTDEAKGIMDAFDAECDAQINKTLEENWRQMWNRAHLKALRIAALLAVADNPYEPVITPVHINWAIELIHRDIRIMQRKIEDGDVGQGDSTRERKVLSFCKEYLGKPLPKGYGIGDGMHAQGIVPRKYFQIRTQRMSAFTSHKLGATKSLDDTLRSLCDSGYLMEMDKMKAAESYGFQGRCFRIVSLPGGELE